MRITGHLGALEAAATTTAAKAAFKISSQTGVPVGAASDSAAAIAATAAIIATASVSSDRDGTGRRSEFDPDISGEIIGIVEYNTHFSYRVGCVGI